MKTINRWMTFVTASLLLGLLLSTSAYGQTEGAVANSANETASQENFGHFFERLKQEQVNAFTGSWEGVFTPEEGGPPPFRILFTFGAEGTVVVSDAGPPTPQNNTAEHGAWERTGNNEFTIIYKQLLFNNAGELDGTFKGRARFRLNRRGNEIHGVAKVNIYDAAGNEIIAGAGTIKCTKIRVEPLD